MEMKFTIYTHGTLFCNLTIVMITILDDGDCVDVTFSPFNSNYQCYLQYVDDGRGWEVKSKNTFSLNSQYELRDDEREIYEKNKELHTKGIELAVKKYLEHQMKCNGYVSDEDVNQAFHQYFHKYLPENNLPGM